MYMYIIHVYEKQATLIANRAIVWMKLKYSFKVSTSCFLPTAPFLFVCKLKPTIH